MATYVYNAFLLQPYMHIRISYDTYIFCPLMYVSCEKVTVFIFLAIARAIAYITTGCIIIIMCIATTHLLSPT